MDYLEQQYDFENGENPEDESFSLRKDWKFHNYGCVIIKDALNV